MFKSIKFMIIGILLLLLGIISCVAEGVKIDMIGLSLLGLLLIISNLPSWELGPVQMTLLAQALIFGFMGVYCILEIMNGYPDLETRRMYIPYGNYPLALAGVGIGIYGSLAAFGVVRRS